MKACRILMLAAILLFFAACNKIEEDTGTLVFKGIPADQTVKSAVQYPSGNYSGKSNVHTMHTANMKFMVAEIWASKDLVAEGLADDFTWYEVGKGDELKLVEEYELRAEGLPAGEYKSIKMVFVNRITRLAVYKDNINSMVDMEGSLNEELCGDETLITQYFSKKGNHSLVNGKFNLNSAGERIRGFKINAGEVTTVFWSLGSPDSKLTDCTFDWVDVNGNNSWDCGTDYIENFNCIKDVPMFSFGVDDGEEDPLIMNAVTDRDGNVYNAVKIGDQIWMKENLRTTRLNDGTRLKTWEEHLDSLFNSAPAAPVDFPIMSRFNNSDSLFAIYGGLYSRMTVMTGKLCPTGWHVSTDDEWKELADYLGSNAGGKLKVVDNNKWYPPNNQATDEYDFSAFGGGSLEVKNAFDDGGRYTSMLSHGFFWTSTVTSDPGAPVPSVVYRALTFDSGNLDRQITTDDMHLSVRCVRD